MSIQLIQKFSFETDDLNMLIDVCRPLFAVCFGKYKKSDDKLRLWLQATKQPSHSFDDGSDYVRNERYLFSDGGKHHTLSIGGMYHGATYLKADKTYKDRDEAAADVAKDLGKKTPPTRLWACTAGIWFPDAGETPNKPRGVEDLLSQITGVLQQKVQDKAVREAVKKLDRDDYFDGSVGLGYRVDAHQYAFTTVQFSLIPVYYSK